jgi:two-component system response regulator YesN
MQPDGKRRYKDLLSIEKNGRILLGGNKSIISTIINDMVVFVLPCGTPDELNSRLGKIQSLVYKRMQKYVAMALGPAGPLDQLPFLYREACTCLAHKYYLGSEKIITCQDVNTGSCDEHENIPVHSIQQVKQAFYYGTAGEVKSMLEYWFKELKENKIAHRKIIMFIMELFLPVIRNLDDKTSLECLQELLNLEHADTLYKIQSRITPLALEIAGKRSSNSSEVYSKLIQSALQTINENLTNPSLSIKWMVRHKVFTNPDYLSKLFKKEVGIKFTRYVMQKRIKMAKTLLGTTDKPIAEIAIETGFGSNPQYFSKVFKQVTGCTPKIWRKSKLKTNR